MEIVQFIQHNPVGTDILIAGLVVVTFLRIVINALK